MAAFYNENNLYAAQWLRNLIDAGLIAPGIVDERDIRDISPTELTDYTQCHFFAGVGVWSLALRQAGWPDTRPVWTGSCPCQPFSAAGKGEGFTDERHLWPDWHHLIAECRPATVFGEQVASKDGLNWFDLVQADMEGTGYAIGATDLCAAGVGAPHIRQRLWFVSERLSHPNTIRQSGSRFLGRSGDSEAYKDREISGTVHAGRGMRLANAECVERERGISRPDQSDSATTERPAIELARFRDNGGLANTTSERLPKLEQQPRNLRKASDTGSGNDTRNGDRSTIGLAIANSNGRTTRGETTTTTRHGNTVEPTGGADRNGPTHPINGFWKDADWLGCRDGSWRPVEPGTFPLAYGVAARVGRLRAYGNAIVAPAAQAFIEAYLDCSPATDREERVSDKCL